MGLSSTFFFLVLSTLTLLLLSIVVSSEASVLKFKQKVKVGHPFNSQDDSDSKTTAANQCTPAPECDKNKCKLPGCFCSGFDIPGGLPVDQVPQMVTLTFQYGITVAVYPSYSSLFNGRTNPNKCPASGTFFVSHQYTDYGLVHDLYAARQEIGVNSITSRNLKDATEKDWENEMGGSWEVPFPAFHCPDGTLSLTADGCLDVTSQTLAYQLLLDKFNTHYKSSNRAPLVVSLGSTWMVTDYKLNATKQFLDYIGKLKDVYVVSAGKVIDWVRNPTPIGSLSDFAPWQCKDIPNECEAQSDCHYDNDRRLVKSGSSFTYRMRSCVPQCSPCYPWIKDPSGTSC